MSDMKYRQKLFIEGPLPGMNAIIAASKRTGWRQGKKGSRWNEYANMKKGWTERIVLTAKAQGIRPVRSKPFFVFTWYETNRRRDMDNIAAGGRKFILDGLKHAGIIIDDSWKYLQESKPWDDHFRVAKGERRPGVLIEIQEEMISRIK